MKIAAFCLLVLAGLAGAFYLGNQYNEFDRMVERHCAEDRGYAEGYLVGYKDGVRP